MDPTESKEPDNCSHCGAPTRRHWTLSSDDDKLDIVVLGN
jgi:hypothetical protein